MTILSFSFSCYLSPPGHLAWDQALANLFAYLPSVGMELTHQVCQHANPSIYFCQLAYGTLPYLLIPSMKHFQPHSSFGKG